MNPPIPGFRGFVGLLSHLADDWARLLRVARSTGASRGSGRAPCSPNPRSANTHVGALRTVFCPACFDRGFLVRSPYRASLVDGDCYRCPVCSFDVSRAEAFMNTEKS